MSKGEATREDMVHIFDELLDASDYAPFWWRMKYDYQQENPLFPREKTDAIRALIIDYPRLKAKYDAMREKVEEWKKELKALRALHYPWFNLVSWIDKILDRGKNEK